LLWENEMDQVLNLIGYIVTQLLGG
jgi:hypothetical protein